MVLDHRMPATSAMMADRVEATEFASVQIRSIGTIQKKYYSARCGSCMPNASSPKNGLSNPMTIPSVSLPAQEYGLK